MKKNFDFLLMAIFSCTILIFINGCKKGATTTKTNTSMIIYTDVKPDSVIISTSEPLYNIDLNNDGIADFIFTQKATSANNCRGETGITYAADVRPAGIDARPSGGINNAIIYNGEVPNALDSLAVIGSNDNWTKDTINKSLYVNTIGNAASCNSPGGPWNFTTNKYLGLKIIKGKNTYYGWARIFKTGATSMILTGYAYNIISNQPILAGQTK
jgi:hypothetical protein